MGEKKHLKCFVFSASGKAIGGYGAACKTYNFLRRETESHHSGKQLINMNGVQVAEGESREILATSKFCGIKTQKITQKRGKIVRGKRDIFM